MTIPIDKWMVLLMVVPTTSSPKMRMSTSVGAILSPMPSFTT